ncbi:unnamed protein product [Schistosoma margrebowiei]|uniref:START domain-containing protein n=2 Tax=Schistosoma margrebowiei TaxID=48269 RepID=A0AA85A2I1_9TREM|nr:unnamed protein product [Schistosoma margrebowiei]
MRDIDENVAFASLYNNQFGLIFGRSESINLAASTSVIEGLPDEQRTSPVRRTFLLAVLFDIILSFILWIIYTKQTYPLSIGDAMLKEIKDYDFSKSLFDTVMLSAFRFILMEITYGVVQSRTPWWSAISTGLTSLILVVKCFIFNFHQRTPDNQGLAYAVLIASLIISWIETTFLIYRVIPQEKAANRVTMCLKEQDETRSLLSSRLENRVPWYSGLSVRSMSNADFYTPQGSLFGDESPIKIPKSHNLEAAVDVAALLHRTNSLQTEMWNLYENEIWGDNSPSINIKYPIRSEALPNYPAKVYRLEGLLSVSPFHLFNDMVINVHETPSWNTTLTSVECIQALASENIDIIHNMAKEAVGGLISARDFVLLRSWGIHNNNCYFICCTSVEHPKCPPIPNYVRAEQVISACIFRPIPDCPNQCNLVWFLCNDLKLGLPQRLLDRSLNSLLPSMMAGLIERSKLIENTPVDDFFVNIQPRRAHRKKKHGKRSARKHHAHSKAIIKALDSVQENVSHSSEDSGTAADNLHSETQRLI